MTTSPATDPAPSGGGEDVTVLGADAAPEAAAAPAEGAPPEGAALPRIVPERYSLTAPEGVSLDGALVDEATPVLQALGLDDNDASQLVPLATRLMERGGQAVADRLIAAGQQQRKDWLDAARADPDIGGARWDDTIHSAAKALDAFGFGHGHGFRQALEDTGFGNHPDMIRLFARLGSMVGEDGHFVRADAGARVEQSREQRWYPGNKE